MSDQRLKSPRLMSPEELLAHLETHHGIWTTARLARAQHKRAHPLSIVTRHGHRSARISEPDHQGWAREESR